MLPREMAVEIAEGSGVGVESGDGVEREKERLWVLKSTVAVFQDSTECGREKGLGCFLHFAITVIVHSRESYSYHRL